MKMRGGVLQGGIAFLSVSRDRGGDLQSFCDGNEKDDSERSAELAENGFYRFGRAIIGRREVIGTDACRLFQWLCVGGGSF